MERALVLLGCGGHARSIADVALAAGYERLLFVDEGTRPGETILGFPTQQELPQRGEDWDYIPATGDNKRRLEQLHQLEAAGLQAITIISPRATLGFGSMIGPGSFVAHHAHIGPAARIGAGCIVNTSAVVEHDCVVGDCSHVSIRACMGGHSRLGEQVFLCAGAVVIDKITIGSQITIGAGAVVIADIHEQGVYVGVPARRVNP
jgi:UDP-N-acetylbacillosamine N-acetyltransferase